MNFRLAVLPFQGTKKRDLDRLVKDLGLLGVEAHLLQEAQVLAGSFNARRRQYEADAFLHRTRRAGDDIRVLAVTDLDLYAGDLNFVFGIADLHGKAAVISLYRLQIGADDATFRERAVKEAVHELGHTFGLRHCSHPECVMYFSNSLKDIDRKGNTFCRTCEAHLHAGPLWSVIK